MEKLRRTGGPSDPDEPDEYDDDFDDEDVEDAREQADWIERLADRDPRSRAEAASEVEPEGRGLDALLGLVYSDPDPSVRVAAVSQLEDSDAHAAVEGLISALGDRDRRVVLEAIDALEFAGDESIIPSLEPLLDSPDPEIREAASEAIEFLE
jgi:HEAT repeat protein